MGIKTTLTTWRHRHDACLRADRGALTQMDRPSFKAAQQGAARRQASPNRLFCNETGGVRKARQPRRAARQGHQPSLRHPTRLANLLNAMTVVSLVQRCLKPWLAIAIVLLAPAAQAADFCAQDDATFRSALTLASIAPGPNRILLGAGKTFPLVGSALDTGSSTPYSPRGALTIEGGYNAECSAMNSRDARSSTLDGAASRYVRVRIDGAFTLSNLTIANLHQTILIEGTSDDDATIRVLHVRVIDGTGMLLRFSDSDNAQIRVENSLFARLSGSTDTNDAGLFALVENGSSGTRVVLVNDTITDNAKHGFAAATSGSVSTYNSIFYGNNSVAWTWKDVVMVGPTTSLLAVRNVIGTLQGSFQLGSADNYDGWPEFVSDTDYNLQFTSPARDSGTSAVPGGLSAYDLEGGVRVVGAKVDRGAYENDNTGTTILLVTNTNDSGNGSLRQAIIDANANPASNIIGFNMSGTCPRTIALNSELPTITDTVAIRGYTQPGAQPNDNPLIDNATICVELTEASGHTIANGLHFTATSDGDSFDVSGLSIGSFTTAILVDGSADADFSIWGNFIGLAADGTTARANSFIGINAIGHAQGTIGGSDAAQRNVIAQSPGGVRIAGDRGSALVNNFIGTTAGGSTARPNTIGVSLLSANNEAIDNLISGNNGYGISISGASAVGNHVEGNRIGVKAFSLGDNALGNGDHGILIGMGASWSVIVDNTIANNAGAGVRIIGDGSVRNRLSNNRFYDNTALGIDLGATGPDPIDNDSTATDATPNHGQNAPQLSDARGAAISGTVHGQLQSANGTFTIELYASDNCDASGYGEARERVGSGSVLITNATASADGSATFALPIASSSLAGRTITAVATVFANTGAFIRVGDSSEFSACKSYVFVDQIFANGFELPQP